MFTLVCALTSGYTGSVRMGAVRMGASRMGRVRMAGAGVGLEDWLQSRALVSEKFLDKVMTICHEEMIGTVDDIASMSTAGLLTKVFKPVVVVGIEAALGHGTASLAKSVVEVGAAGLSSPVVIASSAASASADIPLPEVRRRLIFYGQTTWGSEADLRRRLTILMAQASIEGGAQWDSMSMTWKGGLPEAGVVLAPPALSASRRAVAVPATPSVAAKEGPASPAATEVAAPTAPAPPKGKDTFSVTLKTPDGDLKLECPPDVYLLDHVDELEVS